jgi:hypothetical protein
MPVSYDAEQGPKGPAAANVQALEPADLRGLEVGSPAHKTVVPEEAVQFG